MSAWIVSRRHIDLLVQALAQSEIVVDVDPDEIGRVLWAECLASVADRYPEDADGDRPGPIGFHDRDVKDYTYTPFADHLPSIDFIVTQVGCYQYQSCEHEGWQGSAAQKWTQELRDRLDAAGAVFGSLQKDRDGVDVPWGV